MIQKLFKKSKKKANTEIKSVKKLKDNMYMINDVVVLKVLEDGEIKADFDPDQISEKEVDDLIGIFFSFAIK